MVPYPHKKTLGKTSEQSLEISKDGIKTNELPSDLGDIPHRKPRA